METVVLSGISGAGKSTALKALEDIGFYCIDNLLPAVVGQAVSAFAFSGVEAKGFAVCLDSRSGKAGGILNACAALALEGHSVRLVFLDARNEVLCNRYQESRREHPLTGLSLDAAVERERAEMEAVRARADLVIDTSAFGAKELTQRIYEVFSAGGDGGVRIVSFGFKRGAPADCDMIFDVRFLPNPHDVQRLRQHTGKNPEVAAHVFSAAAGGEFVARTAALIDFLYPLYVPAVKQRLTVGIGCTGGKHRSVAVAERLAGEISAAAVLLHRDIFL